MKHSLYPRLALSGIKKNRKLYLPYLFSCAGMVAVSYLLQSLSYSPALKAMAGGSQLEFILSLGKFVLAAFALLFLFYTNSFLIRRREHEFGLYSVLGMDRRGLVRVVLWEGLFVALFGLGAGLSVGILFSKFCELILVNLVKGEVDPGFYLAPEAVWMMVFLFGIIFLILTLRGAFRVGVRDPIRLIRSEAEGEKPPRANYLLAVLGVLLLAGAYGICLSIRTPMSAITLFFVAVLMVIAATYLLFISGSVTLCRVLQKKKGYYYKKAHFISLSSMKYRMKRNGAGLASICILSTMVLVMLSSGASLYFGAKDALAARYKQDAVLSLEAASFDEFCGGLTEEVRGICEDALNGRGAVPERAVSYRYASLAAMVRGNEAIPEVDTTGVLLSYDDLRDIRFLSAADYEALTGEQVTLRANEALLTEKGCTYPQSELHLSGVDLKILSAPEVPAEIPAETSGALPALNLVISDYELLRPLAEKKTGQWGTPLVTLRCLYSYDSPLSDEETIDLYREQRTALSALCEKEGARGTALSGCACRAAEESDFFLTFGGLFFIGILLSLVFLCAAAVIIYYKQVCEGYEDRARFEVMQKVGMTENDIRQSIRSQILTVFFAPLLFALIHLSFAFPVIWKLLQLFYLNNLLLALAVSAAAFLLFALLYIGVYKLTAHAYFSIVTEKE